MGTSSNPPALNCRTDRADCPGKWSSHKMHAICWGCVQSQPWQCFGVERNFPTPQPKKWISVPKYFSDISQLSSFCLPGTAHWYTGSFGKEPWWSKISGWEGKTSQKSLSCKSPQLSHVHSGEGVEAGKLCLWKCSPERFPQASVWSELKWRRWWQTRIRRPWVRNMLFDCDNLTMQCESKATITNTAAWEALYQAGHPSQSLWRGPRERTLGKPYKNQMAELVCKRGWGTSFSDKFRHSGFARESTLIRLRDTGPQNCSIKMENVTLTQF